MKNGEVKRLKRLKRPAFVIGMHERDEDLLNDVRDTLGVNVRVYWYASRSDNQGSKAMLMVRDTIELRDKIIPLFYKKLHGNKGKQFIEWLEKMGDENVWEEGKYLHALYKKRYFEEKVKINVFDVAT